MEDELVQKARDLLNARLAPTTTNSAYNLVVPVSREQMDKLIEIIFSVICKRED